MQSQLGPDYDLAKRLSTMEQNIQKLSTRDVLLNATFGSDGTTVPQAFAQLQAAINSQVIPRVASGSASGFYVTPTFATIVSVPIPVPDGYTRALVSASGQVTGGNDDAADMATIYAHITVNGTPGPDSASGVGNQLWASVSAFAAFSLTGLNGGVIDVDIAAETSNGTTSSMVVAKDNATLVAQAIFLR